NLQTLGPLHQSPEAEAFRAMGPAAVPYLRKILREDTWWNEYYWKKYPTYWTKLLWFRKFLPRPIVPLDRQRRAAGILAYLGSNAKAAAPDFIKLYKSQYVKDHNLPMSIAKADWASHWDTLILPAITNVPVAASSPGMLGESLRAFCIQALGIFNDSDPEMAPILVTALHDNSNGPVPNAALNALRLGNLTVVVRNSVPLWVESLKAPQFLARAGAAKALGLVISERDELIPLLVNCLGDSVPVVRAEAESSLARARPDALLPPLKEALGNTNDLVRSRAAHLLAGLGSRAAVPAALIVPIYIDELKNGTDWTRWAAASFLGSCGPEAVNATPILAEILRKDGNNRMRAKAAMTLGQIGPAAKEAVPALRQALEDEYKNVREAAAEALKKIQPTAGEQ
ncbi:MAG TPA: HEAT repeat domain-containing protein, partial [Verrucomicrobiae bacterium]|nr:HEAT repeat domain-containing protein [Verrucomicrobiae bacterium]